MLSILFPHKYDRSDLLSSSLYNEKGFYKVFIKDIRNARRSILIESPYLTERRVLDLAIPLKKARKRGIKVTIHTRHPAHHSGSLRKQSNRAIKMLRNLDVKVKLYKDMRHRKISIIDNQLLWEGSLNILSQSNSREVMRRSDSRRLCKQMNKLISKR